MSLQVRLSAIRARQTGAIQAALPTICKAADNPAVFYMRKKGEPAFLVRHSLAMTFKPADTKERYLDLLSGHLWDAQELDKNPHLAKMVFGDANSQPDEPKDPQSRFAPEHADITIGLSEDKKQFELSLTSKDVDSGIIISDELLYEAPEKGYNNSVKIKLNRPEKSEKIKKYIYVMARGGKLYSRVDLPITVGPDGLSLKTHIWTNPDGKRNLEYDEQFQRQQQKVRKDLEFYRDTDNTSVIGRKERVKYQDEAKYRAAKEREQKRREDSKPAELAP